MTLAPFLTVSRLFLRCVLCSAPDHVPLYGFPCVPDLSIPPECEYHLLPGPSRTDTPFQPQSHLPIPVQQPPAQRPDFRIPASGGHLFRTALESRREAGGLSCDDGLALRFSERIASWGPDRCGISGSPPRGYDEWSGTPIVNGTLAKGPQIPSDPLSAGSGCLALGSAHNPRGQVRAGTLALATSAWSPRGSLGRPCGSQDSLRAPSMSSLQR